MSPPVLRFPGDLSMTRQSEGYQCGVASCSQEDSGDHPISDSEPAPNQVEQRTNAVKGPLKACVASKRTYKYGICPIHKCAYHLHLVKSGAHAGTFWVRCQEILDAIGKWQARMLARACVQGIHRCFAESGFAIAERHAAAHSLPTATWSAGWKAIGPSRMRTCAA